MERVISVKRAHGIATITLSDETVLKVPSALFFERRVREGEPFDQEGYARFIEQRAYTFALDRAVKVLALKECSEGELVRKLKNAGYPETAIAHVMATLNQHHFISDARFSDLYVKSRAQKHGRMRIYQELKQKGVDSETARQALETLPEEDELQAAMAQARRLLARNREDDPRARQKLFAALARRGYSYGIAKRALEALAQDSDEDFVDDEGI